MSNLDITEDKKPILEFIEKGFCGNRVIIVEAPPGAGKTFLSVLCAKKLIVNIKINQKVLLITFSRNARAQLNKEAEHVFSSDREKLKQIEITNFHSFFQKYVWAYRSYLGLPLDLDLICPQKRNKQIRSFLSNISNPKDKTIEALSSCLEFQPNNFIPPHCPKKYREEIPKIKKSIFLLIALKNIVRRFLKLKNPFLISIKMVLLPMKI